MTRRRTLSWLVVAALLAATALAAARAWDVEERDAAEANGALARQAASVAQQEIAVLAAGVRGGDAVLEANGDVDPDRFDAFARDVLRRTAFPALAFASYVRAGDRDAIEAGLEGPISQLTDEGFRRARERPAYAPITSIFPRDRLHSGLLGFDLLSEPSRRATALAARVSGQPRITPPLTEASTRRLGATIFSPVYRGGDQSAPNLTGFFVAGITGRRIATAVAKRVEATGSLQIRDEGTPLAGPRAMPDGSMSETVPILGRSWTVAVEPASSTDVRPAVGFATGGLALSALAAGILVAAGRRERDLQRRRVAAELRVARESLLTRIADAVEQEIEVDARLTSLARTLVPAVGEICTVYVVTPERSVRRAGIASTWPEVEEVLAGLGTPPATSPVRAAITSREPVLYTKVSARRDSRDPEREAAPWPPRTQADLQAHISSSMIVPLVARGRVLGALSLAVLGAGGRPAYTREDLAFVSEVASHAAVALDNARLYEQQRDIAGILQTALLPPSLPEIAGVEVAASHRPGLDGAEIGGDFYDVFASGESWIAVVGDVCGKGPAAAALTALVRHTLRATADEGPEGAVARVHEAIRSSGEDTYCTLCCAEFERNGTGIAARVTTAGHPEPRIIGRDGAVRRLSVTGPLVGGFDGPVYGSESIRLESGEVLFMCSDGVPEARRQDEVFGDERLEALLGRLQGLAPAELIAELEREVLRFVDGRPRDDIALFALRAS